MGLGSCLIELKVQWILRHSKDDVSLKLTKNRGYDSPKYWICRVLFIAINKQMRRLENVFV